LRPKAEDRNKVDFKMLRIVAVVVALAASACAFVAPVATQSASSPLKMSDKPFAGEVGAQVPLGFWDPLGLLKNADQERFDRLRYVELKHGRVAMLAVLGQIWTKSGKTFPGTIDYAGTKFSDVPTGYKGLLAMPGEGLGQIILFIGFLELFVMKDSANGAAPGEFPGDFRTYSFPRSRRLSLRRQRRPRLRLGQVQPGGQAPQARHRTQQRPRCPDGHPRPHGPRTARRLPLAGRHLSTGSVIDRRDGAFFRRPAGTDSPPSLQVPVHATSFSSFSSAATEGRPRLNDE